MKKSLKGQGISPVIMSGVIVVIIGGIIAFVATPKKSTSVATTSATATPTPTASPTATSTPVSSPVVDAGITWLATPQNLGDLKLFKALPGYELNEGYAEYYKAGSDATGDIIYAFVRPEGPGNTSQVAFHKVGSVYQVLPESSFVKIGTDTLPLADGITADSKIALKSILPPSTITVKGSTLNLVSTPGMPADADYYFLSAGKYGAVEEVASTSFGKVYLAKADNPENLTTLSFVLLKLADGGVAQYQLPIPFATDDNKPAITWKDGSKNVDVYRYDGNLRCGRATGVSVLKSNSLEGFAASGVAKGGVTIYEPTSADNALLKEQFGFIGGSYYDEKTQESVTIPSTAAWLKYHPVALYKDALGRVGVMTNSTYGQAAECGKPVVYLYPTHTQAVTVKVGASITKSEPAYNHGWSVIAQPNGQLALGEKQYGSLFWEGTGSGAYPEIHDGFVVRQTDLASTLREHLSKLGLNAQESADFLEFWLPKMPSTPYVRLTWFGTNQMNTLAPLTVTPQPDTMIRIFLDFQGLQKPVTLPAQHLGHVERRGFTLVEWGGLLQK